MFPINRYNSYISRSFSIRLLILSWWMFVCLITACYSANLAATLTVQKFDNEIKSVEELLSSKNQFRFATAKYLWIDFKNSKSDFHQKIAQTLDAKITVVENRVITSLITIMSSFCNSLIINDKEWEIIYLFARHLWHQRRPSP